MCAFNPDDVRRPKPGERIGQPLREPIKVLGPRLEVWIIDDELTTVCVHFLYRENRHRPCLASASPARCPLCRAGFRVEVQHWLYVAEGPHACYPPRLLKLTPGAVENCPVLSGAFGGLWGRKLVLWRVPCEIRGAMFCECNPADETRPASLAKTESCFATLIRMWSAHSRKQRDEKGGVK